MMNQMRRYEVSFKCAADVYQFGQELEVGDFVAVQAGKGYNVGVVSKIIPPEVLFSHRESKWQQILHKLVDDRQSIEQMLSAKITFENDALARCRHYCCTHRIGNFIRPIAAEFQFDRKKLTIYVMKAGDASVCKLVRKLFDSFKIRISILDIDSPELACHYAVQYLTLSGINLPLHDVYMDPSIIPYVPPTQQLGKSKATSLHHSLSQSSAENVNRRYGDYDPSSGYYAPQLGGQTDPRQRPNTRAYPTDYGYPSIPQRSTSANAYQRTGYYPSSTPPGYSTDEDYYRKDPSIQMLREGGGRGYQSSSPDEYLRDNVSPNTHFTLAEHQDLANYYRGNEKYPHAYPEYASSHLPSEEDLYANYYRETELVSALEPRQTKVLPPHDLEEYLSAPLDSDLIEGGEYPLPIRSAEVYDSYAPPRSNINHESLTQARGMNHHPYHRTAAAPPLTAAALSPTMQSYITSTTASMNRSHVTYPIEDQQYLLSPESNRFCGQETHNRAGLLSIPTSISDEMCFNSILSFPPPPQSTGVPAAAQSLKKINNNYAINIMNERDSDISSPSLSSPSGASGVTLSTATSSSSSETPLSTTSFTSAF